MAMTKILSESGPLVDSNGEAVKQLTFARLKYRK